MNSTSEDQKSVVQLVACANGDAITDLEIDKVFWVANSVHCKDRSISIEVDEQTISTMRNLELKTQSKPISSYASNGAPLSSHREWHLRGALVSSGVLLVINQNFALIKRSVDAPTNPGAWTNPAGRCDDTPGKTAFRELREELQVFEQSTGKLHHFRSAEDTDIVSSASEIDILLKRPTPNVLYSVETYLKGVLLERTQLWAYYDWRSHTLELRAPLATTVPEPVELRDPEHGRLTALLAPSDVRVRPRTPSLSYFCGFE